MLNFIFLVSQHFRYFKVIVVEFAAGVFLVLTIGFWFPILLRLAGIFLIIGCLLFAITSLADSADVEVVPYRFVGGPHYQSSEPSPYDRLSVSFTGTLIFDDREGFAEHILPVNMAAKVIELNLPKINPPLPHKPYQYSASSWRCFTHNRSTWRSELNQVDYRYGEVQPLPQLPLRGCFPGAFNLPWEMKREKWLSKKYRNTRWYEKWRKENDERISKNLPK